MRSLPHFLLLALLAAVFALPGISGGGGAGGGSTGVWVLLRQPSAQVAQEKSKDH